MQSNRTCALRNFGADQFFQAPAGQMLGVNTRFIWEAIIRPNNVADIGEAFEWIFGNVSPAGVHGFNFVRGPDTINSNGTRIATFIATVGDGAASIFATVQMPLAAILAKTLLFTMEYDAVTTVTPTLRIYINGSLVTYNVNGEFTAYSPSTGQATMGAGQGGIPLQSCDVIAYGYTEVDDSDDAAGRIAKHFDEVFKRANIPPISAYGGSDAIPWLNNYDVFNDTGVAGGSYPRTLTNSGDNDVAGNMQLTGGGTTLVFGTPPIEWGSAQYTTLNPPPGPG
jgi:hypothetical protein